MSVGETIWDLEFFVVDTSSSYNRRQPALNKLRASISIYFATVEIWTKDGSYVIKGDKNVGQECFIASKAEAKNNVTEEKLKKEKESPRHF